MGSIFISYRRSDSEGHVGRLYDHLVRHFSIDSLFMDIDDISPGQDFVQVLEDGVAACQVLLAVIGPQWLAVSDADGARRLDQWNDFVRLEVATALRLNKLVIPILVQGAKMPSPADLPEDLAPLARRNAVELSHKSFAYDVEKLAQLIQAYFLSLPRGGRPLRVSPEELRQRQRALDELRETLMQREDAPLAEFRRQNNYQVVLGDGNAAAELMFVGEVPGEIEARGGKPFSGPSGEVLNEMLTLIGWGRDDIYITNIIADRLSNKRKRPTQAEVSFYSPYLLEQINIVQPEMIVTLGGFAMEHLLSAFAVPVNGTITEMQGQIFTVQATYGEIRLMPVIHPASIIYQPTNKAKLRQAFEQLARVL